MNNQVLPVPGLSRNRIEQLANAILRQADPIGFMGRAPVDIEAIFEFYVPEVYGIQTGYRDLSSYPGILGVTNSRRKICWVHDELVEPDAPEPVRRRGRATVAHEIGHCALHVSYAQFISSVTDKDTVGLFRTNRSRLEAYEDPEWQAWEMAGFLLLPRHLMERYAEEGCSNKEMAEKFDVNAAFVKVRLDKLKIG